MHGDAAESTDGMIIAAVLTGDHSQFAHLVRRYQRPLAKFAYSRLGNRAGCEDVVQETFLCAFRWLHTYDSRFSFRTWLWRILLNQCARYSHRRNRVPRVDLLTDQAVDGELENQFDQPGREPSPLSTLLQCERTEIIESLLQQLPDAQSDALRLRFYAGLTFPEIADAMGSGISTAKVRVRQALLQLADWLGANDKSSGAGSEWDYEAHD